MIDWNTVLFQSGIVLGGMAISGATAWIVLATRTSSGLTAVGRTMDEVKTEHSKRLDGHDVDLLDIRANYVSRRELDEKKSSSMASINANYANIKEQLTTHGRWLEYAVFNKKPDQPSISG